MTKLFGLILCGLLITNVYASEQVGTITQAQGTVKIFTHPGKKVQGPPPHALFENEYYSVQDAKIGEQVEQGNIVRTAPGAKARIVFNNGDQYNVGSATAYRVFWNKKNTNPNVQLMYGKIRGIIEKGGPRGKLTIRTRTATMGVRGTDFFIADGGPDGGTEVSILRGAVEVKPENPAAKPIEVKAGYSAEIPSIVKKPEEKKSESKIEQKQETIELRKTTKEDLVAIQKSSQIKLEPKKEIASVNQETVKQIAALEKKAVETTIKDIKVSDPKLYAQIQAQTKEKPITSTDELNSHAVQQLFKVAPKAPEKRKPFMSELDDLEDGAYEKYFKIID